MTIISCSYYVPSAQLPAKQTVPTAGDKNRKRKSHSRILILCLQAWIPPHSFLLLPLLPDVLELPVIEDEVSAGALAAHDGHGAALDLAARPPEDAQQEL